jgi:hypothetical protein
METFKRDAAEGDAAETQVAKAPMRTTGPHMVKLGDCKVWRRCLRKLSEESSCGVCFENMSEDSRAYIVFAVPTATKGLFT